MSTLQQVDVWRCLIWWLNASSFVLVSCMCGSQTTPLIAGKVISEASYVRVELSLFWKTVTVGVSWPGTQRTLFHCLSWLLVEVSLSFPASGISLEARLPFVLNTKWSQDEISLHSRRISQLTRCTVAEKWGCFSHFLSSSWYLWLWEAQTALC